MLDIVLAASEHTGVIQTLWREYWESLALPADFQNFANEVAALPGVYAPPGGRLLLASLDGAPVGTAAFRPLTEHSCEAKRLYVHPRHRGKGIGRTLLTRLITEARAAGYREMFGDPHLHDLRFANVFRVRLLRGPAIFREPHTRRYLSQARSLTAAQR
jgi:putative acetyltransferase